MSLSSEQAAKLRELASKVKEAAVRLESAEAFEGRKHQTIYKGNLKEAERQLDAYITSLTGESK